MEETNLDYYTKAPPTTNWDNNNILNCDDIVMFNNWDDIRHQSTHLPMKRRKINN